MDDDPIVRFYDASANPDGWHLPGVPLDDILQSRWAALPEWLQASADAIGWYSQAAPQPTRGRRPAKEE